jgi:hypothetical protein
MWYSVTWSPELGIFCAVSGNIPSSAMTSPDGITWTIRTTTATNSSWQTVVWAPEISLFCAVATTGDLLMTSPDGIVWTARSVPTGIQWQSVCWSAEHSMFVVGGGGGTSNILNSAIGLPNSRSALLINSGYMSANETGTVTLSTGNMLVASGNLTVGTTTSNAQIQLGNTVVNRKIILWEGANNDHQYYGFGVNSNVLRYQVNATTTRHIFYAGTSSSASTELMRIQGNGNVGIGLTADTSTRLFATTTTAGSDNLAGFTNTNNGTATRADVRVGGDGTSVFLSVGSSTYTGGAVFGGANGAGIHTATSASGGLALSARATAGNIRLYTGGDTERIRIDNTGLLLSNKSDNARGQIHIKNKGLSPYPSRGTNYDNGIAIENSGNGDYWAISSDASTAGLDLVFYWNGSSRGYLLNTVDVGQIDFTGQHRDVGTGELEDPSHIEPYVGMIVISTGQYFNSDATSLPTINEALPVVELCSTAKDKRVYGVLSDREDTDLIKEGVREYQLGSWGSTIPMKDGDKQRLIINSLGEGAMWVCDVNGSLENGDYVCSSNVKGYGMKQPDDLLHNYTVAKLTQDCDCLSNVRFLDGGGKTISEEEYRGRILMGLSVFKAQFVGCTYHCG